MSTQPCQVCQTPTDDHCEVCREPTCDAHFFEQEYLGCCEPCRQRFDAQIARGEPVTAWDFPLRKPLPEGANAPPTLES